MKLFTESIKYIFKNFLLVFMFAIIPACFIGGLLQPFSILNFIVNYPNLVINNFGDILGGLFGMPWTDVFNWLFAAILLTILLSAMLGNIENHFRSGKINISQTSGYINNNFLATALYFLFYILVYLIFKFVLSLFVFILHIIFGCLKATPSVALYVCSIVLVVAMLLVLAFIFSYIMLGLIDTLNTGYSFRTSLSNAGDLLNKKNLKTVLNILLPFVIITPFIVLGMVYNFGVVANVLSLIVIFMYYPVLGYTTYYEYANIYRYDNIKHTYYR